jgi:hypothetical protein
MGEEVMESVLVPLYHERLPGMGLTLTSARKALAAGAAGGLREHAGAA